MNDNLPPLPESFCYKHDGTCWPDTFSAGQMKAYARAAIERQSVPEAAHTKYLEEIYGYLCSTSPKGYADEAFRNVPDSILPDSVRNRLAEQAPSMGDELLRLEAANAELLDALVDVSYTLEKARIWGGMEWKYNPLHPVHYLPARDKVRAAIKKHGGAA